VEGRIDSERGEGEMSTLDQREREFDLCQRILRAELSLRRDPIKQGLVTRRK